MKIAIIVGHNIRAQGARRITDGRSEFDWNAQLSGMICAEGGEAFKTFYRDEKLTYRQQIADVYARSDDWGADVSIELHFNASAFRISTGTEVLSSGSTRSLYLSQNLQRRMLNALGLKDRGVKTRRIGRGAASLRAGRAPAALIEPYFGTNQNDCAIADARMAALAEAIASGALASGD